MQNRYHGITVVTFVTLRQSFLLLYFFYIWKGFYIHYQVWILIQMVLVNNYCTDFRKFLLRIKGFWEIKAPIHFTFQSKDKTPKQCADWCHKVDRCKGFVTVDTNVLPNHHTCFLKDLMTYPSSVKKGVTTYYKLEEGK